MVAIAHIKAKQSLHDRQINLQEFLLHGCGTEGPTPLDRATKPFPEIVSIGAAQ